MIFHFERFFGNNHTLLHSENMILYIFQVRQFNFRFRVRSLYIKDFNCCVIRTSLLITLRIIQIHWVDTFIKVIVIIFVVRFNFPPLEMIFKKNFLNTLEWIQLFRLFIATNSKADFICRVMIPYIL